MNILAQKAKSWQMFNEISPRYDLLNHLLSVGLDIYWRHRLCSFVPQKPNLRVLDLATGTGDVLFTLLQRSPQIVSGYGVDLAQQMLAVAQKKAKRSNLKDKISFHYGDAQHIPKELDQFDLATMAFGIRNVENTQAVLSEIYRVLRPSGRVLILEFSLPGSLLLKTLYLWYLRKIVPLLGKLLTGNYQAYYYLNQTIENFPYGERFCKLLRDAKFTNVQAYGLSLGIATLYVGDKL